MFALPQKGGESRKLDRTALPAPRRDHMMLTKRSITASTTTSPAVVATMTTTAAAAAPIAPANMDNTALVEEMLQVFRNVLNMEDIFPADNFFDVGGHSLLAATLIGELTEIGINISITDLYQYPSVQELATSVLGVSMDLAITNRGNLNIDILISLFFSLPLSPSLPPSLSLQECGCVCMAACN